jgi:MFS family permease
MGLSGAVQPGERRIVGVTALLHGLVHGNILAIPVFLDLAWRSEFGADDVTLGLLAGTAYACFGLGSVPFGHLADRKGAPRLLVLCLAGIVVSLAFVAASPGIASLAASLALLGLFSGIYHPAGLSLISRVVREPGRAMGWHGMGGSLGVAAGPAAVGGLLGIGWPWRSVVGLLLVPGVAALGILVASRLRDPVTPGERRPFAPSARGILTRSFVLVLLVYAFAGIAYWGSLTFLPRFVGAGSYAFLLALGAVGQVLAGHLADRVRPERALFVLSLVAAVLLAGFASAGIQAVVVVPWAFGLLLFSLEPLQNTLVTSEVRVGSRGLAFGMTFLSVFGLGSTGAVLAGFMLQGSAATVLFPVLGAALAVSGLCGLVARNVTGARVPQNEARPD